METEKINICCRAHLYKVVRHIYVTGKQACHPDTTLFDQGFAVITGGKKVEAKELRTENDDLKAVKVKGDDGINYVLAVNFGTSAISNINPTSAGQKKTC